MTYICTKQTLRSYTFLLNQARRVYSPTHTKRFIPNLALIFCFALYSASFLYKSTNLFYIGLDTKECLMITSAFIVFICLLIYVASYFKLHKMFARHFRLDTLYKILVDDEKIIFSENDKTLTTILFQNTVNYYQSKHVLIIYQTGTSSIREYIEKSIWIDTCSLPKEQVQALLHTLDQASHKEPLFTMKKSKYEYWCAASVAILFLVSFFVLDKSTAKYFSLEVPTGYHYNYNPLIDGLLQVNSPQLTFSSEKIEDVILTIFSIDRVNMGDLAFTSTTDLSHLDLLYESKHTLVYRAAFIITPNEQSHMSYLFSGYYGDISDDGNCYYCCLIELKKCGNNTYQLVQCGYALTIHD